ncbi:MAG TPA: hypothetical protein DG753_10565 [Clostridium sp.]|nr:hypothetical protein [Clostridium sp.]
MNELFKIAILTEIFRMEPFFSRSLLYKKSVIERVKKRTDEEKLKDINEILNKYGFLFDVKQDIVYASMYPPQRKIGYCSFYDGLAPSLNMRIHCEPIYFQYDNRRWLIELWKGQYGITTGAEVGVYTTDKDDVNIPGIFSGPFYDCISDNELLQMQFTLKKDGKEIIERKEKHWWLAGFDVGTFSWPEQLSLDVQITFPYIDMEKAFIEGLYHAGYRSNDIIVRGRTVEVFFTNPKTKQPDRYSEINLLLIQKMNRLYCDLFNFITRDFTRTIDKIDFLRMYIPILLGIIINSKINYNRNEIWTNFMNACRVTEQYQC